MRVAGRILSIIFLINIYIEAQEIDNVITVIDSNKVFLKPFQEKLQFKNFFRSNVHKSMNQTELQSLRIYDGIIDTTLLLKDFLLSYEGEYIDSTKDFKKSYGLLLEYAKYNQNKYDLGEFSRYLGISRNILAIILAILSVVK